MKINDVIVEAPMGILQRTGQKIMSKVPGSTGIKAQGRLDTGRVANDWKRQYMQFLGRTGQKASTENLTAFLKRIGLDDQTISKTVSEHMVFERLLTRTEIDKLILSAAQNAAGGSSNTAATAPADDTEPNNATAQNTAAPAAAKPGLLKRAAGALGRSVKGAMSKIAGQPAAAAAAPTAASTPATAKPAGSNIDLYINNWAKNINAAKSSQEKIALAKEVINFLKDRKGSPEGQRGAAMAKAVLKRSNDPRVQQIAQSGAFAMERKIYTVANKLLEAVGLSWKDLGYRILVTESTATHVMIGIR